MSPPGRPKGEFRVGQQHEGGFVRPAHGCLAPGWLTFREKARRAKGVL